MTAPVPTRGIRVTAVDLEHPEDTGEVEIVPPFASDRTLADETGSAGRSTRADGSNGAQGRSEPRKDHR